MKNLLTTTIFIGGSFAFAQTLPANFDLAALNNRVKPQLQQKIAEIAKASNGSEGVGGGDSCEERIQQIRDDIYKWIQNGGPKGFKNIPVSVEKYSARMTNYLFVNKETNGAIKPVTQIECSRRAIEVQGVEKICRFDKNFDQAKITCNAQAFMDKSTMPADEQYRLVHHEYAGLAGLEIPSASQSSYIYSNQISAFLENQVVKRLAVRPSTAPDMSQLKTYKEAALAALPKNWDTCGFGNHGTGDYVNIRQLIYSAQTFNLLDEAIPKIIFETYDNTTTGRIYSLYKTVLILDSSYKKILKVEITAYKEGIINDGDLKSPVTRKGYVPSASCDVEQ